MIGMIAAVSKNSVIGVDGHLPFDYPEDMKHFRKTTANSTIIMGRKTWESIGRVLPKRRNMVISRTPVEMEGVETFDSLAHAIMIARLNSSPFGASIWLIGGASIYEEGMQYADEIHLTLTPDVITAPNAVKFPWINPQQFAVRELRPLVEENNTLMFAIYSKI